MGKYYYILAEVYLSLAQYLVLLPLYLVQMLIDLRLYVSGVSHHGLKQE